MARSQTRVLGTFTLAMMTMAAIVSLRNLSLTAELGLSAVFFLILAAVIFFIPISLVTAELASSWPRPGGCYVWVDEAFGKSAALIALWLSWMASISWFPTILAFTATMLGHLLSPIYPGLEDNTSFIIITMLLVFWGVTLGNFIGIKFSGLFSSIGVVVGTLIPGALIIILGIAWILIGNPTEVALTVDNLIPDFKLDNLILFASVLLSFGGVELAAYHIRESKDPQKSYPHAVCIAAALILFVYIFGTTAIVFVVPQQKLIVASGLIQAYSVFFNNVGLEWLVTLLALFLFIGAVAGINSWIIGPAKGMLVVAQDGFFPKWMQRINKHDVPTALLLSQAVVVTVLSLVFLYIQDNSASIWFLTALSAKFTCAQYFVVFCAAIALRYSKPKVHRAFKTPAIWLLAGLGMLSCVFGFVIVYVPHAKLVSIEFLPYCLMLFCTFLILLLPTWFLIEFRSKGR